MQTNRINKLYLMQEIETVAGHGGLFVVEDVPFWFVPSSVAHEAISLCQDAFNLDELAEKIRIVTGESLIESELYARHFITSISFYYPGDYKGRSRGILKGISEIWFHLTDAYNLKCSHCLFRRSEGRFRSLSSEIIKKNIVDAYHLGCCLFCFIGGEPFVYPDFVGILDWILHEFADARIAVLSTGTCLDSLFYNIKKLDCERMHILNIDGTQEFHDRQRGKGTFQEAVFVVKRLKIVSIPVSVAMAVLSGNLEVMPEMLKAGDVIDEALGNIWRYSLLFKIIRELSLMENEEMVRDPLRFITGGGDIDQAICVRDGDKAIEVAADPYGPLYRAMVSILLEQEIGRLPIPDRVGLILRMGDISTQCFPELEVNFTHCNCLLSIGSGDSRALIRNFYGDRAKRYDEANLNPVKLDKKILILYQKRLGAKCMAVAVL